MLGIITGSGTYALPGFEGGAEPVATRWGEALVRAGARRAPTCCTCRATARATSGSPTRSRTARTSPRSRRRRRRARGGDGLRGGRPDVALGSLICFDDLHFLANRLGRRALCTFHDEPGDPDRGHWIFEDPFSPALRAALLEGARDAGVSCATAAATATSTGRASTRRRRSAGSPPAESPPSPRRPARRRCSAARPSCPTRCSATRPTTRTGWRRRPTPVAPARLIAARPDAFAELLAAAVPRSTRPRSPRPAWSTASGGETGA